MNNQQEQVEKMIEHIISLIPKMEVVVNVGGDADIVDLKEILPYELEKAFTQIIKDTEERERERNKQSLKDSWDRNTHQHWDLGDALKALTPPITNDNK